MLLGREAKVTRCWRLAGGSTPACFGRGRYSLVDLWLTCSSGGAMAVSYERFFVDNAKGKEKELTGEDVSPFRSCFFVGAEIEQLSRTHFVESLTKTIGRPFELITTGISPKHASLSGISFCSEETTQTNASQDNNI